MRTKRNRRSNRSNQRWAGVMALLAALMVIPCAYARGRYEKSQYPVATHPSMNANRKTYLIEQGTGRVRDKVNGIPTSYGRLLKEVLLKDEYGESTILLQHQRFPEEGGVTKTIIHRINDDFEAFDPITQKPMRFYRAVSITSDEVSRNRELISQTAELLGFNKTIIPFLEHETPRSDRGTHR